MADRRDEFVVEGEIESTWDDDTGLFAGSEMQLDIEEHDLSSVEEVYEQNPAYITDGGELDFNRKLPEIRPTLKTQMRGLETPAGDGDTAATTLFLELLAVALQQAPVLTTGSTIKAASSPSTTSITEDDSTNTDPSPLTRGCIGVTLDDGTVEARWGSYSSGVWTLDQALSDTPSEGAEIYGAGILLNVQRWTLPMLRSIAMQFVSNSTGQHVRVTGCGVDFDLGGELTAEDIPTLMFTLFGASQSRPGSQTADTDPSYAKGVVMAGGEFLLSKYGNSAIQPIVGTMEFTPNRSLAKVQDPNHRKTNGGGMAGWRRATPKANIPELKLKVDRGSSLPTGFTASTWREAIATGENELQYTANFGNRIPGQIFSLNLPRLKLVNVVGDQDVDELDYIELTLRAAKNAPLFGIGLL